jgi:glutamate-1-semialdehyde 2,1-aminomutase
MNQTLSHQGQLEQEYRQLTPNSAELYERAQAALPGGDTRQSVFFKPYPLFLDGGQGAYVEDEDGNRYLDCSNCWTALVLGHAHPAVVEAVAQQVARGTAFAAANRFAPELAELLKERVPSIEKLRFANSGTEATMFSVRAARAFTGRRKIVKMLGSYHGSHDDFEVLRGTAPAGVMPTASEHVLEVEFNNKADATRVLEEHGDDIAAVVVEGIMGAAGMIPPEGGYIQHLRDETAKRQILLILDEVITLRLALGGAQELYDVRPDLTAMGKIIGGGFPVGAFGGREDVMQQFSPLVRGNLHHSGTFNANPISMVAGLATLRQLDADTLSYANRLGERFAAGVGKSAAAQGVALHVTGAGSLRNLHFTERAPTHAAEAYAGDAELLRLLHLKLLVDGILSASRGMFAFSTVTSERDVDRVVEKVDEALRWLRPLIDERAAARGR